MNSLLMRLDWAVRLAPCELPHKNIHTWSTTHLPLGPETRHFVTTPGKGRLCSGVLSWVGGHSRSA